MSQSNQGNWTIAHSSFPSIVIIQSPTTLEYIVAISYSCNPSVCMCLLYCENVCASTLFMQACVEARY